MMVKLKSNQKHRIIDARQIGKPVKKITSGMLGTILALSIYSGADKIKIAEAEEISSSNSQTIEEDQVIAQGFYLRSSEQENGSVTTYTYTPELNTKAVYLNEGDSTTLNNFENMEYLEITITDDNCSLDFIGKMPNLKTLIIRSELDELNCLKSLPEMPNIKTINFSTFSGKWKIDENIVKKFPNLINVDVTCRFDYKIVENLKNVKTLYLKSIKNYKDEMNYADFKKLESIENLKIDDCEKNLAKFMSIEDYNYLKKNTSTINLGYNEEFDEDKYIKYREIIEKVSKEDGNNNKTYTAQGFSFDANESFDGHGYMNKDEPGLDVLWFNIEENQSFNIKDLKGIESIKINIKEDNFSLDFLKELPFLKKISISNDLTNLKSLEYIPTLPNVEILELESFEGTWYIDDKIFEKFPNLKELKLECKYNPKTIENLSSLKKIVINTNDGTCDIDFSKLTFLDELEFSDKPYTVAVYLNSKEYKALIENGVKVSIGENNENDENLKKYLKISQQLDDIVNSLDVTERSTDKEKLDAILIYVLENLKYDEEVEYNNFFGKNDNNLSKSFYEEGLLYAVFEKDTAICGNYAAFVEALNDRLNNPIKSHYLNNNNHAWNIIVVDGEPYYVDSTWLDESALFKDENTIKSEDLIRKRKYKLLDWYMVGKEDWNLVPNHYISYIPPYIVNYKEDNQFEFIINKRKYIVPIGVLVGLLSAFGLAKKVNNKKKKLKKIKSEKEYKDTAFDDDIDEFYTDINDFDNYYSDFKTSKR